MIFGIRCCDLPLEHRTLLPRIRIDRKVQHVGGKPSEIEIVFTTPDRLQEYANRKDVEVTSPSSLVVRGDDWWSAWSSFFF